MPSCGKSGQSAQRLVKDMRLALLVAFGDPLCHKTRVKIQKLKTLEQIIEFCDLQPDRSLIFVLDQFNNVQSDAVSDLPTDTFKEVARTFFLDVRVFHLFAVLARLLVLFILACECHPACLFLSSVSDGHIRFRFIPTLIATNILSSIKCLPPRLLRRMLLCEASRPTISQLEYWQRSNVTLSLIFSCSVVIPRCDLVFVTVSCYI